MVPISKKLCLSTLMCEIPEEMATKERLKGIPVKGSGSSLFQHKLNDGEGEGGTGALRCLNEEMAVGRNERGEWPVYRLKTAKI